MAAQWYCRRGSPRARTVGCGGGEGVGTEDGIDINGRAGRGGGGRQIAAVSMRALGGRFHVDCGGRDDDGIERTISTRAPMEASVSLRIPRCRSVQQLFSRANFLVREQNLPFCFCAFEYARILGEPTEDTGG